MKKEKKISGKRKKIWILMWILTVLFLTGCGRELENREFPDTLVIRDTNVPFDNVLQKKQENSSKYLDYGQVRCVILEETLTQDGEKLKDILLAMEKRPIFSRNIYFFAGDENVLKLEEEAETESEKKQDLTGFYQKSTEEKKKATTLGSLLYRLHNGRGEHKMLKLKAEDGEVIPQEYISVLQTEKAEETEKAEADGKSETTDEIQQGIAREILRFHVLANSDSEEDQQLKLEIKDHMVQYLKGILDGAGDVQETKERIAKNQENIRKEAENEVRKRGYDYPVKVYLENCYFPMKTYGDCTFPAGNYEALRVCIGKAKGRNWWCVLYPGLCFADSVNAVVPEEKKQELKNILTEEEYDSLFDWREDDYQIRSGFLKLWRQFFGKKSKD